MSWPLYRIADSSLNRRSFLMVTGSLAAATLWADRALGVVRRRPAMSDYPFQLGVASGEPTSTGVVLWTRLAPNPLAGGGMPDHAVEVPWRISEDERMTRVLRQGITTATPAFAHSVHVEVEGLRPDRWYWYQFKAGNELSPTGRTRTAPAKDGDPQSLRLAFASCQNFEQGLFTAYEHMAREDLDLVVHLGDYIYEGAARGGLVRQHAGPSLETLAEYRTRHAQYKMDTALQNMHALAPWIVTWDDHEVQNDYAGDTPASARVTREAYLARRANAYQAYYEHMPLRRSAVLPRGPYAQLYRRLSFGPLAEFFVLDTRQYRTPQPCGGHVKPPCDGMRDPHATILGKPQRDWLFAGMKSSTATWNVVAQQVMMARVDRMAGPQQTFSSDQWPGYEVDRRRVLRYLHDQRITNPIVLSGDIHSNWANQLTADVGDAASVVVAPEFVGTSISSGGDGTNEPKYLLPLLHENPFVKYHNEERGYVRCIIGPQQWKTDFQTVPYVSKPGAPLNTRASFVVEAGQPRLNRA